MAIDKKAFSKINFSGNENSWFDLWHTHGHLKNSGKESSLSDFSSVFHMIELYEFFREKLETYTHPFQLWIEIWEDDISENAVYIHTANPNSNNFPLIIGQGNDVEMKNIELANFIKSKDFTITGREAFQENVFYLNKKEIGLGLDQNWPAYNSGLPKAW